MSDAALEEIPRNLYPNDDNSRLQAGSQGLAEGPQHQVHELVTEVGKLFESEKATAETLRVRTCDLQERFAELSAKLYSAVASRRLRNRCHLVSFF